MDFNINDFGVEISNKILNVKESRIDVIDIDHLNNIIAECDDITKNIIVDSFKKSYGKVFYVESVDKLVDKQVSEFSTVSGPEVYNLDSASENSEFDIDSIINDYASKNEEQRLENEKYNIDEIVRDYGKKSDLNDTNQYSIDEIVNQYASKKDNLETVVKEEKNIPVVDESTIVVPSEVKDNNISNVEQIISDENQEIGSVKNNDYVVDPSQRENMSLFDRLQSINNEGPIFVDEDRIVDKDLNVYNAISLGRIKTKPLSIKQNPMVVDTRKCSILEMNQNLHKTFRKVCNMCKEKIEKFKFKKTLNQAPGTVSKEGTLLLEMSREDAKKIGDASKKLSSKTPDLTNSFIMKLKDLKGSIMNNNPTSDVAIEGGKTL